MVALAADTHAAEPAINSPGMKLVPVAAGEFTMGSDAKPANWDESPRHRVTISAPLLINETKVTVAQFRQFKPGAPLNGAYAPLAAGVSWNEAVEFCAWPGRKEGCNYRSPTEAGWECAARRPRRWYCMGDRGGCRESPGLAPLL